MQLYERCQELTPIQPILVKIKGGKVKFIGVAGQVKDKCDKTVGMCPGNCEIVDEISGPIIIFTIDRWSYNNMNFY